MHPRNFKEWTDTQNWFWHLRLQRWWCLASIGLSPLPGFQWQMNVMILLVTVTERKTTQGIYVKFVFLLSLSLSELFITWPYPRMPAKQEKRRNTVEIHAETRNQSIICSSSVGMIPQENKESPRFLWFRWLDLGVSFITAQVLRMLQKSGGCTSWYGK